LTSLTIIIVVFLKNSFFSGMFRCSDTTVCNFRYRSAFALRIF